MGMYKETVVIIGAKFLWNDELYELDSTHILFDLIENEQNIGLSVPLTIFKYVDEGNSKAQVRGYFGFMIATIEEYSEIDLEFSSKDLQNCLEHLETLKGALIPKLVEIVGEKNISTSFNFHILTHWT